MFFSPVSVEKIILVPKIEGMRVHFIAIGGAAMHNLALALHFKGYKVTGSDDAIHEPSRSRLDNHGLLPEEMGWFQNRITPDIDAVILGMHATKDNPELVRAQQLGLRIYSYPEYLYEQSKDKKRVVIAGSHGKTTITSMVLHVLQDHNVDFDFMVGAQIEGFDTMVRLSDAPVIVMEGDEYFSSPLDMKAKFLWYYPHTALISGIAWDHINVYPTFDSYLQCFHDLVNSIEPGGKLTYFEDDFELKLIAKFTSNNIKSLPYDTPAYEVRNGQTFLQYGDQEYGLHVFGEHNLQNIMGAMNLCTDLGISEEDFLESISRFKGAARRLELIGKKGDTFVYKDFAHSPSKLKATIDACKSQFAGKEVIAVMELHTFSSLNMDFIGQYQGSMNEADQAYVYYNPEVIKHKRLRPISDQDIADAFGGNDINIHTDANVMFDGLRQLDWNQKVLLLMSSGTFDGIDIHAFAEEVSGKV